MVVPYRPHRLGRPKGPICLIHGHAPATPAAVPASGLSRRYSSWSTAFRNQLPVLPSSSATAAAQPLVVVIWILIAVLLVGYAVIDFSSAFGASVFGVLLALYVFGRAARARDSRLAQWVLAVCGFVMLAAGPASCSLQTRALEARFAPVIRQLENFPNDHDSYPNKLEVLVPFYLQELPSCQWRSGSVFGSPVYMGAVDSFSLICRTFIFNRHTYNSIERRWEDWD